MTTTTDTLHFTRNRYSGNYSAQSPIGVFSIVRIQRRYAGAFELTLHADGNARTLTTGTLSDCKRYAQSTLAGEGMIA